MSATCFFITISAPFCDAAFKLKILHFTLLFLLFRKSLQRDFTMPHEHIIMAAVAGTVLLARAAKLRMMSRLSVLAG